MGTNFYAVPRVSDENKKTLHELLDNSNYKELKEKLCELTKRYHIGKRSYGWQFLFQAYDNNDWDMENSAKVPWDAKLESVKEYLSNPDIEIQDEYGESFTPDKFWSEIEDCLYKDEKHYDLESYHKAHPEGSYYSDSHEFTVDGIRFSNRWFC